MKIQYSQSLKYSARKLRGNQTESEKLLWRRIRNRQINGYQFFRQRPIGNYIVDFYCPRAKLVVEIDGGQHFEGDNIVRDIIRDAFMKGLNLRVMRFTNLDILKNIENVLDKISREI